MVMNTQQLQYLIEIERTRSVSQAAANLYMGQPNLSRILRDTENALGFAIFERTRKGVRPTERGEQFLQHARNILRESEYMEQLGPNSAKPNRFRICLPRSYGYMDGLKEFLRQRSPGQKLDAVVRECHPRQAMELVGSGTAEIAVIRYSVVYQDYFSEQAKARSLSLLPLDQVEYQILLSQKDPLAGSPSVGKTALARHTELLHRDTFYPFNQPDPNHCRIYTVDRLAQLQLLQAMERAFLWSEPLPAELLERFQLAQRPCTEGGTIYQNGLLYNPACTLSETEKAFIDWITMQDKS